MGKHEKPILFGKTAGKKVSNQAAVLGVMRDRRLKVLWLAVVAALLVAALVLVALGAYRNSQQARIDKAIQTGTKLAEEAQPEGVEDEAQAQAWKGDVTGADSKLQAAIAAATTNEEKHRLLVQRAVIALNANQQQKALDSIVEAEKYGATKASSDTGALAAEEAKNRPLAVEYYKKSIERIDKTNPLYEREKQTILDKIKELQQ